MLLYERQLPRERAHSSTRVSPAPNHDNHCFRLPGLLRRTIVVYPRADLFQRPMEVTNFLTDAANSIPAAMDHPQLSNSLSNQGQSSESVRPHRHLYTSKHRD